MKRTLIISALIIVIVSCKKEEDPAVLGCTDSTSENYDPNATDDDGSCTYIDTTTFPIDLTLYNSGNYNFDNPNLWVTLKRSDNGQEDEQTLNSSDYGVEEQNYFSMRMQVDEEYIVSVVDPNDYSWAIYEGDTIYTYNTVISTLIGITSKDWGYEAGGYKTEGTTAEVNFAGQTDLDGNYTAGHFRIILRI